jgi:hypothetical protein
MEEMLGLGGKDFGINRKFLDSKGAKQAAAVVTQEQEEREPTPAEIRNQQILDDFKERRGASLFEQHAKGDLLCLIFSFADIAHMRSDYFISSHRGLEGEDKGAGGSGCVFR